MAKKIPITMNSIKKMRKEKDISQKRLALLTGVSRTRIQDIEVGYAHATPEEIKLLTAAIKHYQKEEA